MAHEIPVVSSHAIDVLVVVSGPRSPFEMNVLIDLSNHPLVSFGGKNDPFCAHKERGCVPAP